MLCRSKNTIMLMTMNADSSGLRLPLSVVRRR
jgi:hypothetical protein